MNPKEAILATTLPQSHTNEGQASKQLLKHLLLTSPSKCLAIIWSVLKQCLFLYVVSFSIPTSDMKT